MARSTPTVQVLPFAPTGNASLSVSATSARALLPTTFTTGATTLVVRNTGSVDAYIALSAVAGVVATVGGFLVPAGEVTAIGIAENSYLAAITASGSTTLQLATGPGVPTIVRDSIVSGSMLLTAGESHIGAVGGATARLNVTFTRPANVTAYVVGQLVANSTTALSVVPMSFAISRATGKGGMVRRVRMRKTGTSVTNASFRLHLYTVSPVASNGDGAAWLTDNSLNYIGALDVTCDKAFTDGAAGNGVPNAGSEINFTTDTVYGLLEARGAYTPVSGEQITVELEVLQN